MPNVFTKIAKWSAALMGGIALTACSKVVSFVEEVEIDGKTYQVERKAYFEKRPIELEYQFVRLESEILITGLGLPAWKSDLAPMYAGLNNNRQLVIIGVILGDYDRARRGNPSLPYVAFKVDSNQWVEIPVPPEFDGRKATFLIGVNPTSGEKALIKAPEREFRNSVSARGIARVIDLKLTKPEGKK